jgi:hypothetical protein
MGPIAADAMPTVGFKHQTCPPVARDVHPLERRRTAWSGASTRPLTSTNTMIAELMRNWATLAGVTAFLLLT